MRSSRSGFRFPAVAALIALAALGGPGPASAMGPLRVLPSNPRYFTDGSGRAVYLTGSHHWSNLVDIGPTDPPAPFDFTAYLDRLQALNHTFVRLWRWELTRYVADGERLFARPQPWTRTGPGRALDGKPRFDLTRFDPEYFGRLRARVAAAAGRGFYVAVMLFEGWALQRSEPPWRWDGHPFNVHNNINGVNGDADGDGRGLEIHTLAVPAVTRLQEAYVRKVIDTLNDLDNVLYEIANEAGPYSTDWQYQMIRVVKDYQAGKPKQHPVGMTFQFRGGRNSALAASSADWISPNSTPSEPYLTDPPAATGAKVVLSDTDHLCGLCQREHGTPADARAWVWKSFLRGLNPIYMDPLDHDPVREAARRAMGQTRAWAGRVELAAMAPRPALASSGYCLATASASPEEYLVYLPRGGSVSVNLSATPGTLSVEWFDPRTGRTLTGGPVAGGAPRSFPSPFPAEAVLYLRAGR
jgi:hypothetical protein